jgi:uncharacterized surface protein with fasciclin (FAS1) repeats
MKITALVAAVAAAALLSACGQSAPKQEEVQAPAAVEAPAAPTPGDIVTVASENGAFTTLLAAATAAGLVDTLKGPGPFTIFAPNDAAFAKLPAGTVENLLKPENKDKLAALLTYHVVPASVASASLSGVSDVATVNGATVKIDASTPGTVKVNGATVVAADVAASNGVIHVIDTVIMPPETAKKK